MRKGRDDKPARQPRAFKNVRKDPERMIESLRKAYDPDAEFRQKYTKAIVPEFFKALTEKGKKDALPDLIETARIIEVNAFGAYRIRTIDSSDKMRERLAKSKASIDTLRRIVEAGVRLRPESKFSEKDRENLNALGKTKRFREDFAVSSNTNFDGTGNPFEEYIPIMGGPFNHQLYLHDMLDGLAKSFEAWNHNPLAHQIIKINTHFVLGRGVTYKARDSDVQARFAEWWKKNDIDSRLEYWSDMLGRDGELMIRFFKGPDGELFVRWVDPSTIWEIVTDAEDIERVFYYHQQYPTAYQVLYGAGTDKRFDPTKFASSKYVINQIPADEMLHVKINCSPNEKRGRSDLFPVLGWLKRYKDFQTAVVLRAIIQSTFAWKNKLEGTDADVDAFISAFGSEQPEFGSVYVENGASTLEPMTADLKGGDGLSDCPGIVNAISVGSGTPKEYLGLTENGTRATAVVASEPGIKKFQSRQLLLARLLRSIGQKWYENEVATGKLSGLKPSEAADKDFPTVTRWMDKHEEKFPFMKNGLKRLVEALSGTTLYEKRDGSIDFDFPEIANEDASTKIKNLETGLQDEVISHRRFSTSVAKELGVEDYDYDKEREEIAQDKVNQMDDLYRKDPPPGAEPDPADGGEDKSKKSGGLSGDERRDIKAHDRT